MKPRIRWTTYDTKKLSIEKWIKPYFGEKLLGDIEPIDILHWQGWLDEQRLKNGNRLSPTYVRKLNSDLASLLNHAERNYGLKPNPMKKVAKTGKTRSGEMQIWSKDEFNRFLDAICDKAKATTRSTSCSGRAFEKASFWHSRPPTSISRTASSP